jgi:hypothetical protein
MVLLPALQRRLPGPRLLRDRTVERRLFDLLVDLQLRLELRPELAALPGAGLEYLGERTLGLLVLALQQVDRVHRRLLAAENCGSYDRAIARFQSWAARACPVAADRLRQRPWRTSEVCAIDLRHRYTRASLTAMAAPPYDENSDSRKCLERRGSK